MKKVIAVLFVLALLWMMAHRYPSKEVRDFPPKPHAEETKDRLPEQAGE